MLNQSDKCNYNPKSVIKIQKCNYPKKTNREKIETDQKNQPIKTK